MRPFNTYGPRQSEKAVIASIIRQVVDDNVSDIRVGNTSTKRDFNYVDDTVKAFIALSKAEESKIIFGSVYNSGTGKSVSIDTVLKTVISLANSNKKVVIENNRFRLKNRRRSFNSLLSKIKGFNQLE